jgi:hypothetical protein
LRTLNSDANENKICGRLIQHECGRSNVPPHHEPSRAIMALRTKYCRAPACL